MLRRTFQEKQVLRFKFPLIENRVGIGQRKLKTAIFSW
jgi:hypothetical protein